MSPDGVCLVAIVPTFQHQAVDRGAHQAADDATVLRDRPPLVVFTTGRP